MNIRDLSFKVGDEVIDSHRIIRVEIDGVKTTITYSEEASYRYRVRTVTCDSSEVEVLIDGT